ncbi:MAG: cobalamin B12-binding domain-containing protein, partial [Candidatus Omnitrophica bacterium]|nr:cobalamin B12-binding domain-containing protein [Candidatus Omnitrophota bacterium]
MDNKKVLLINPAYENREIVYFPLGLGYIAGSCDKHGIEVKCIDVNATRVSNHQILEMIENEGFHIVGIGGFLTQVQAVIELTNLIKSRAKDVIVIIGGIQVFGCERFIMETSKADIICVGESEMLFPELIKALYDGKDISKIPAIIYRNKDKVINNEGFPLVPDLDEINFPKYDAFNMETYITQNYHGFPGKRTIDFICSRGCPYSCTYCINSLKPVKMRYRSPDNIVREIRLLKGKYKIDDFS